MGLDQAPAATARHDVGERQAAFMRGGRREPDTWLDVWRENERAVDLFCAMSTQWRWSEGRRVGLDLAALPVALGSLRRRLPRRDRAAAMAGLQVMEAEALRLLASRTRTRQPTQQE